MSNNGCNCGTSAKDRMTSARPINIVSDYPRLNFSDLYSNIIKDGLFRGFYGKDASLFYLGRGALFHAIKLLHLADSNNILVPSYHCGVDIEAIIMAGAAIRYYKINKSMDLDIADLLRNVDTNTKAVVITHYFGFPQSIDNIKNICQEKKLFLIEDCAHALLSVFQGKALGSFGDISIFSQRKSLPIPDGGALLINNSDLIISSKLLLPSQFTAFKNTIGMLYNSLVNASNIKGVQAFLKFIKYKINMLIRKEFGARYSTGMEIDSEICNLAMSNISKNIMNRSNIDTITENRRNNFNYLLERIPNSNHIIGIYTMLPEGVCPLFFPVRTGDTTRREVQNIFRRYGVQTYVFGENLHRSLPGKEYPDSVMLSNQILGLPVHQNLKTKELEQILDAINSICFK